MEFYQRITLAIMAGQFLLLTSCGRERNFCGIDATGEDSAPRIISIKALSEQQLDGLQAVNSEGRDPWLVLAELRFEDNDGDLGAGFVSVSLDGVEAYQLELSSLFSERGLSLEEKSGTLAMPFRLTVNPEIKETVINMAVGVALIDQKGQVSNCGNFYLSADINRN